MSVAFTSDAKARWAAEWVSWPQFGQFWAQVARHALRKAEAKGTFVQIERQGRKAVVSLDAIEPSGRFLNRVATELTLVDPAARDREDRDGPGGAGPLPGRVRHYAAGLLPVDVQSDQGRASSSAGRPAAWPSAIPTSCGCGRSIPNLAFDRGGLGRPV